MRIAILGAGAWGTALAISLAPRHAISLWTRDREACEAIAAQRASAYLPGFSLPPEVTVAPELPLAVSGAELLLCATATAGLRGTATAIAGLSAAPFAWACKGFESGSTRLPHEIAAEALADGRPLAVLSGPSFAHEVARGLPAAIVLASRDAAFAQSLALALNGPKLRLYSSGDLAGVELGGALKNVVAIAAGISDGMGLGLNARAALITRGLAEISRLGVAMGGQPATFAGLAGLGDLVLTCTGDLSRNREVGRQLAAGHSLGEILARLGHVAEGVVSTRSVKALAERHGVDMPIVAAVHAILFESLAPREAVGALLARDPKPESR